MCLARIGAPTVSIRPAPPGIAVRHRARRGSLTGHFEDKRAGQHHGLPNSTAMKRGARAEAVIRTVILPPAGARRRRTKPQLATSALKATQNR